jgi:hypothetical protein
MLRVWCGWLGGLGLSLLAALSATGCEEKDEVKVNCEPIEAGSEGCVGLPPGARPSSAVYPVSCDATVVSDGEKTHWICDRGGRRWLEPL